MALVLLISLNIIVAFYAFTSSSQLNIDKGVKNAFVLIPVFYSIAFTLLYYLGAFIGNALSFGLDIIWSVRLAAIIILIIAVKDLLTQLNKKTGDRSFYVEKIKTLIILSILAAVNPFIIGISKGLATVFIDNNVGFSAVNSAYTYIILLFTFVFSFLGYVFAVNKFVIKYNKVFRIITNFLLLIIGILLFFIDKL